MQIHTHTQCMCMCLHWHTQTCIHTYTHIHTHAHIHTSIMYIHTYTHTRGNTMWVNVVLHIVHTVWLQIFAVENFQNQLHCHYQRIILFMKTFNRHKVSLVSNTQVAQVFQAAVSVLHNLHLLHSVPYGAKFWWGKTLANWSF